MTRASRPGGRATLTGRLRVAADVLFQELGGETVLLNLATGTYFGLDEVGTRAWQLIQEHGRLAPVRDALLREYEVPAARLEADLVRLAEELLDHGLLELVEEEGS